MSALQLTPLTGQRPWRSTKGLSAVCGCQARSAACRAANVALRIVLYVEGPGESSGDISLLPAPGEELDESHLGAAHRLIQRCAADLSSAPEDAIRFLSPLRLRTGRVARGSTFLERQSLRQLLTWPSPNRRPNVAVVLVDADGDTARRATLLKHVHDVSVPSVVGVAVQEFESWLIADHGAVASAFAPPPPQPPQIEMMKAREAKGLLDKWTSESSSGATAAQVRMTLARTARLSVLDRLSAFQQFRSDLRDALNSGGGS